MCLLLSLIYPAVYLHNTDLRELSVSYAKKVIFSLKKWKAFLFIFWNICLLLLVKIKCKILVVL